jgi:LytR cell envelope-related transcriptional attenuator
VKNATTRPGLAARTATALGPARLQATNGGNAAPASRTVLSHATGSATATGTVAQVVKAGRGIARRPQAGLSRALLILVLGNDFKAWQGSRSQPPRPARRSRPRL